MSKKLKMPEKGLFGLPSSVRQTNGEENTSTQVPENQDIEELSNQRTGEPNTSDTSILENSNTSTPEYSDTLESTNQDTEADWKPVPIIAVEIPSTSKDLGTPALEELHNFSTQVPNNLNTEELNNSDTEIQQNSNIEVSNNPSTQVLKNPSGEEPKNSSTEQLEVQDTPIAEVSSAKDVRYQSIETLPKPQKDNRKKDEKKPARKQASVHLTGATLKALHSYAYDEGLEKSEVVEKALQRFIPEKYFE